MSFTKRLLDLHILVVEDNDDAREITQVFLQAYGASVTVASVLPSAANRRGKG